MTDGADALTLARQLLDALNRGDRDGMKALLAEDVVQTEPLTDAVIRGPTAVIDDIWSMRNSFPDLHNEIADGFACGNRAVVEFTAAGTYEPYTYGAGAKKVTWRGCLIIRVTDRLIDRVDVYLDWLLPVEQLGELAFAAPRH